MTKFMETVSNLEENFCACLLAIAGRDAFAVLEKPRGFLSRRVGGRPSTSAWLPADNRWGCQALTPGGGMGHRARHFRQLKCAFSLQDILGQQCPAALEASRQPANQTQARWVSGLCVDRLPVDD